jgi:hypothetical protein
MYSAGLESASRVDGGLSSRIEVERQFSSAVQLSVDNSWLAATVKGELQRNNGPVAETQIAGGDSR